eukprot:CCRYP_004284-RB/>CCRYP_004284-RB protein AED:0.05 eAED:0.05 QI:210/1/1/1/0.75/0.77/9/473/767
MIRCAAWALAFSAFALFSVRQVRSEVTVIDLSRDFQVGNLENPGAKFIEESIVSEIPQTRRLLVLERGKIVADYSRQDVDPDEVFILWSAQKSIDSLLFGLAIDFGNLTLDETLGDVFPDEALWVDDADAEYKKSVTMFELLTMTSGLVANYKSVDCCYDKETTTNPDYCPECGDEPGKDLKEAISFLTPDATRGEWNYVDSTILYSYIITARTGMSPRELMASTVFPALGINNDEIGWRTNSDGMDVVTWGMYLNAHQMAKFGQLILQNGLSALDREIISPGYITDCTSKQVEIDGDGYYGVWWYGFWWYTYSGQTVGNKEVGDYFCAIGAQSQYICVHPELERVLVRQSDCEWWGCDGDVDPERIDVVLFEASTSFGNEESTTTTATTSRAVTEITTAGESTNATATTITTVTISTSSKKMAAISIETTLSVIGSSETPTNGTPPETAEEAITTTETTAVATDVHTSTTSTSETTMVQSETTQTIDKSTVASTSSFTPESTTASSSIVSDTTTSTTKTTQVTSGTTDTPEDSFVIPYNVSVFALIQDYGSSNYYNASHVYSNDDGNNILQDMNDGFIRLTGDILSSFKSQNVSLSSYNGLVSELNTAVFDLTCPTSLANAKGASCLEFLFTSTPGNEVSVETFTMYQRIMTEAIQSGELYSQVKANNPNTLITWTGIPGDGMPSYEAFIAEISEISDLDEHDLSISIMSMINELSALEDPVHREPLSQNEGDVSPSGAVFLCYDVITFAAVGVMLSINAFFAYNG